jgi:hypothetical protein
MKNTTYFAKIVITLSLCLGFISNSYSQNGTLSNQATVSILTCGNGNESYSLFGHTAIRISDPVNFIDLVYNYGAFDFTTPNFVAKFTKGDLQYFVVSHPFLDFLNEYTYEKRSVFEQELNIPQNLKQKLFDNLNTTLYSDQRYYTYKFIDKNCTSMVVDIINKTIGKNVIQQKTTLSTYRTILYPYFDNHFYEKLGTSIIFGTKVDQLGNQLFLPIQLLETLKTSLLDNRLLCKKETVLLDFKVEKPFSWWNNPYTYLLLLSIILLLNNTKINTFFLFSLAVLGIFFVFIGDYSNHKELQYNYNILLFNPTLLLLLFFIYTKNKKWVVNLSLFNLFCLAVYVVILINKAPFLIVFPLIALSTTLLFRLANKNRNRIPIIL